MRFMEAIVWFRFTTGVSVRSYFRDGSHNFSSLKSEWNIEHTWSNTYSLYINMKERCCCIYSTDIWGYNCQDESCPLDYIIHTPLCQRTADVFISQLQLIWHHNIWHFHADSIDRSTLGQPNYLELAIAKSVVFHKQNFKLKYQWVSNKRRRDVRNFFLA